MAFMTEGDIPVQITDVKIAESKLNKKQGSLDICVEVTNEDRTQSDWWPANLSADYTKISNRSGWTNTQVSHEKLVELGYKGPDFSAWPTAQNFDWLAVDAALKAMIGTVTKAHCEKSRCGKFINVRWLDAGGGSGPVAVDLNALNQMGASLQQPAQPAQTMQPAAQPAQQPAPGGFGQPAQQPATQPAPGGFGQ